MTELNTSDPSVHQEGWKPSAVEPSSPVLRFVDSGDPIEDGALGYVVLWEQRVVHGVRRKGEDLYTEDLDGIHRGGFYPGGAMHPDRIVFKSFDGACKARDQGGMRIEEILRGFAGTLRNYYERQREKSNAGGEGCEHRASHSPPCSESDSKTKGG